MRPQKTAFRNQRDRCAWTLHVAILRVCTTETVGVTRTIGIPGMAKGGTQVERRTEKGAAAQNMIYIICCIILIIFAIRVVGIERTDPLPDVAAHVICPHPRYAIGLADNSL